jgi:hypothetical protein
MREVYDRLGRIDVLINAGWANLQPWRRWISELAPRST